MLIKWQSQVEISFILKIGNKEQDLGVNLFPIYYSLENFRLLCTYHLQQLVTFRGDQEVWSQFESHMIL